MSAVKVKRLLTGSRSETVTARLNAAGAFVTATREALDRVVVARTDATTGLYAFDPVAGNGLVPNAEITPAGTAWVIVEPGGHIVPVIVLAGAPVGGWDVSDLLAEDPSSPDPMIVGARVSTDSDDGSITVTGLP